MSLMNSAIYNVSRWCVMFLLVLSLLVAYFASFVTHHDMSESLEMLKNYIHNKKKKAEDGSDGSSTVDVETYKL